MCIDVQSASFEFIVDASTGISLQSCSDIILPKYVPVSLPLEAFANIQ
jgi:hypothetical protein